MNMTYEQLYATSRERMEEIMKVVREKCKNDKIFEQELFKYPTETLKKEGLKLQPDICFQFVKSEEDTERLPDSVIPLTFKFVETEAEANALPASVFPLVRTQKNNEGLSMDSLDKVAAGGTYKLPDGTLTKDIGEAKQLWDEHYRIKRERSGS